MHCSKCGELLRQEDRFCASCGAACAVLPEGLADQAPDGPAAVSSASIGEQSSGSGRKKPWLWLIVGAVTTLLAVAVLLLTGVMGFGRYGRTEGRGFETPEAAAEAYLSAMHDADLEKMEAAFAMESYVEHFDFEALLLRLQAYIVTVQQRLPNETDFTAALNLVQRQASVAQNITFQYLTLAQPESEALSLEPVQLESEQEAHTLTEELGDPRNLETLRSVQLVQFHDPSEFTEIYASEANQANIGKQCKFLGCEKLQSVVAEAEVNGQRYLFCFNVGCYDGKWYLVDLGGNIGVLMGLPISSGGVIRTSEILH